MIEVFIADTEFQGPWNDWLWVQVRESLPNPTPVWKAWPFHEGWVVAFCNQEMAAEFKLRFG